MNKFSITNKRNNMRFGIIAEQFPEKRSPAWGQPAGRKYKKECDEWELINGVSAGTNEESQEELWDYPDTMEVTETNIDAEIAEQAAKAQEKKNALDKVKKVKKEDLKGLAEITDIVMELVKLIK